MAILTLNPVFTSLSGHCGDIVFYMRRGTQCARSYIIPPNPNTPEQKNNRSRFAEAVRSWQQLTGEEKTRFTGIIRKRFYDQYKRMSAYNIYISEYMKTGKPFKIKRKTVELKNSKLSSSYQLRFRSVSHSLHSITGLFPAYICPESIEEYPYPPPG